MRHRKKLNRSKSKRSFRNGTRTHRKNGQKRVMRGGYRL